MRVTVTIEQRVLAAVDAIAERDGVSRSAVVERIASEGLEVEEMMRTVGRLPCTKFWGWLRQLVEAERGMEGSK